jgi:hypothetical protein
MRELILAASLLYAAGAHVTTVGERWRNERLAQGLTAWPAWLPSWATSRSTAFMPCNYSGLFNLEVASAYGLAGEFVQTVYTDDASCLFNSTLQTMIGATGSNSGLTLSQWTVKSF